MSSQLLFELQVKQIGGIKMWTKIGKEWRAILLLTATLQLATGATIIDYGNKKIITPVSERDQLMTKVFADLGATIKCLVHLERSEINDNIYKAWHDHLDRIQLHPTKPATPSLSMDFLYEKQKATLIQLQELDNKCSAAPLQCDKDAVESENKIPMDLIDMGNSLTTLARTMYCVLRESVDHQDKLYHVFDNSFERIHSNYDAVSTPFTKVYEDILQTSEEIKNLSENCNKEEDNKKECMS